MKKDNPINEAETSSCQDLRDVAGEALAVFRGSGQGGSVVLLLADRKAEVSSETEESRASSLEFWNFK